MPRLRCEMIEGGLYHVYNRFARGEEVFGDPEEAICFVDRLHEVKTVRRAYLSNLKQAMKEDELGDKVDRLPWWQRDRELDVDPVLPYVDVLGRSTGLERQDLRPEQFISLACECLGSDPGDVASRRQDREIGRLRRLIVSCGIERWGQRAGELAEVLRKRPVVVSRWVSEASRIKTDDQTFADEIDALDQSMAKRAIERLAEFRSAG